MACGWRWWRNSRAAGETVIAPEGDAGGSAATQGELLNAPAIMSEKNRIRNEVRSNCCCVLCERMAGSSVGGGGGRATDQHLRAWPLLFELPEPHHETPSPSQSSPNLPMHPQTSGSARRVHDRCHKRP